MSSLGLHSEDVRFSTHLPLCSLLLPICRRLRFSLWLDWIIRKRECYVQRTQHILCRETRYLTLMAPSSGYAVSCRLDLNCDTATLYRSGHGALIDQIRGRDRPWRWRDRHTSGRDIHTSGETDVQVGEIEIEMERQTYN